MPSPSLVHVDTWGVRIPGKRLLGAMGTTHCTWCFFFFFLPLPSKALKVSGVNPARPW